MTEFSVLHDAPILDADPFSMEVLRNPYPFHQQLREIGPIAYIEKYNSYAVGRYDEVRTVLKDWETFTSTAGAGLTDIRKPGAWRQPGPIVESDPPAHKQVRDVLAKIISPKVIRGWQTDFDAEANAMADRLCEHGDVDGAKDIAEAYVTSVFPASLGLKAHRENMIIVGNYNFNALGPQNELFEKSAAALASISEWFENAQQMDGVVPGSFAEQIFHAEEAGELEPDVAPGLVRTFLRGGMDTTISGISSSMMFLSQKPELWSQLRADRSRLKAVFDEAIRLESPVQSMYRTTTKAVELSGVSLRPDIKVQVFLAAASRDPSRWTNPDEFDIDRPVSVNLAFGHGIHNCIGQMIARMEAESIISALLDRCIAVEPRGEPTNRLLNNLRTLDTLPLRLMPA